MLNNGVFVFAIYKFFTMRNSEPHLRRLTLFKILALQACILGGDVYFTRSLKPLKQEMT